MRRYQIITILCLTFFSGTINLYQNNWIGIAKAGTISGQVVSLFNDNPIEGAIVRVLEDGEVMAFTLTDSDGHFKIPGLPEAHYHVVAENHLYGSLTIESVPVVKGLEVMTHFILIPRHTIY